MPFTGSQCCFPGLRTLISGEHFPCLYRCLLKHILALAVTAVLVTLMSRHLLLNYLIFIVCLDIFHLLKK